MNDDGFSILGPAFINVGANGENVGLRVSDFTPAGYLGHDDYQGAGTDGDFTMMIIDKNGQGVHTYTWTHEWDWDKNEGAGDWADAGHWYDAEASQFIDEDPETLDIVIPAGTGLFMSAPPYQDGDAGSEFKFPHAGEVYQQNVPVEINDDGFTCIANPFPASVKVSTLFPTGYLGHDDYQGAGTDGDFTMMIIDKNGQGVHTYTWTHEWDWDKNEGAGDWADAGHWYDAEASQFIDEDPETLDFAIPGGQGLFLSAPPYQDGDEGSKFIYTFVWPLVK